MKIKKYIKVVISLVLIVGIVGSAKTVTMAEGKDATPDNGLELSKTAKDNEDGTYTINLEAYTTGTVKTITKGKPTDIVLVLDQSGSMSTAMDYDYIYAKAYIDGSIFEGMVKPDAPGYIYVNGIYKEVKYKEKRKIGNIYIDIWQDENKQELIPYKVGSTEGMTPEIKAVQFYNRGITNEVTRLDALKKAVNLFTDNVIKDDGDHRIALVGFADGLESNGDYNNTEMFVGGSSYQYDKIKFGDENHYTEAFQSTKNENGQKNIKASIEKLSSSGATRSDLGINMAKNIFNYNPISEKEARNKVVVMFTDGEPTTANEFSDKVASDAISYSKSLKDSGATIYTVGVSEGLDVTQDPANINTSDMNRYMHYVSSNYPNASSIENAGIDGDYKNGDYLAATDTESLSKIFSKISEDISSPKIELDSKTILKDVMSDYFNTPDIKKINVYTSKCTGKDNGKFSWGEREVYNDAIVTVNKDKGSIDVSGYDYTKNFVAINETTSKAQGSKLIVEFTTSRIDGFIGGSNIDTNDKASGIYSKNNIVEEFELPKVEVPLKFELSTGNNQGIYIGSEPTGLEQLIDADPKEGLQYKMNNSTYTLDGKLNKFVDITYTISKKDGTILGNYKVLAGTDIGTWDGLLKCSDLVKNTDVNVTADVVAISNSSNKLKDNEEAKIYVFTPEITIGDDVIFLGESIDVNKLISTVNWVNQDTHATKPSDKQPTLTYGFKGIADAKNYKPAKNVEVVIENVFNGTKQITEYSKISDKGQIQVVSGELSVKKTIDNQYTKNNKIKANQTFVFRIDVRDTIEGQIRETFYQTIDFSTNQNIKEKTIILHGLSKGYYTVTEESDWSWKYIENSAKRLDNYSGNGSVLGLTENQNILVGDRLNSDSKMFYGSQSGTVINSKDHSFPASVKFENEIKNINLLGDVANSKNHFSK